MATLAVSSNVIVLSFSTKLLVFSRNEGNDTLEKKTLLLAPDKCEKVDTEEKKDTETTDSVCSAISRSGKLLVNSSNKTLTLWDTSSWTLVGSQGLARAASSVCFSELQEDCVVVADKSGDVYSYKVDGFVNEGAIKPQLLLGHVSMLLRVAVSSDNKYIITCDRDEKIRVSHFPNAYNVNTYCLGHTESVTCLSFLEDRPNELISGSSDGTVRLWDYVSGKQLLKYCFNSDTETCLVLDLKALRIDATSHLICVIAHSLNSIRLLSLSHSNASPEFTFIKDISIPCSPRSLMSNGNELFVLSYESPNFLTAYHQKGETLVLNESLNENLTSETNKCIDDFDSIRCHLPDDRLLAYFSKRKIDDTQEYHKRKKERLLNQIDKNK